MLPTAPCLCHPLKWNSALLVVLDFQHLFYVFSQRTELQVTVTMICSRSRFCKALAQCKLGWNFNLILCGITQVTFSQSGGAHHSWEVLILISRPGGMWGTGIMYVFHYLPWYATEDQKSDLSLGQWRSPVGHWGFHIVRSISSEQNWARVGHCTCWRMHQVYQHLRYLQILSAKYSQNFSEYNLTNICARQKRNMANPIFQAGGKWEMCWKDSG